MASFNSQSFTESVDEVMAVGVPASTIPDPNYVPVSEVPTDIDVEAEPATLRLTSESDDLDYDGNLISALWWQNLPLTDGLLFVSRIYGTLQPAIENYQRKFPQAWWSQYPRAIIRKRDKNKAHVEAWTKTRDGLRENSRILTTRFANRAYQYVLAKTMQTGALANLFIGSKLYGRGMIRDLASDLKWGNIQPRCSMYPLTPVPIGLEAYIAENSGFARGHSTAKNAIIDAFPLWITDIWGNRGTHMFSIDEFVIDEWNTTENPNFLTPQDVGADQFEAKQIRAAMLNATRTIVRYGMYEAHENRPSPVDAYKPSMPIVENGSVIAAVDLKAGSGGKQNCGSAYTHVNWDGCADKKAKFDAQHDLKLHSVFAYKLWNNYNFWTLYLHKYFPEMEDRTSDFYKLMVDVLKLCTPASALETLLKTWKSSTTKDLSDLATNMVYKKDNAPNTATIVKFSPLIWDPETEDDNDADSAGLTFSPYTSTWDSETGDFTPGTGYFEMNFERYNPSLDNPQTIIRIAKRWPHLNPTMFSLKDQAADGQPYYDGPYVHNATPGLGSCLPGKFTIGSGQSQRDESIDRFITPTGKYASILDYAMTYSISPKDSIATGYGITTELFKKFVSTPSNNEFVYTECPDCSWVVQQPLIDNTDLFQCGFTLLVIDNNLNTSDWEDWYKDVDHYNTEGKEDVGLVDLSAVSWSDILTGKAPCAPTFEKLQSSITAATLDGRAHVVNPKYRKHMGINLVFIGMGIFDHPVSTLINKSSGNYAAGYNLTGTLAGTYKERLKDLLIAVNTSDSSHSYNWSVVWTGSTNFMDETADNNSDSQLAVCGIVSHGDSPDVFFFTFAPEYGPVTIAQQYSDSLGSSVNNIIPKFMGLSLETAPYIPTKAKFTPKNVRFDMTSSIGMSILAGGKNSDVSVNWNIARYRTGNALFDDLSTILFFLDKVEFKYPHVKANGSIIVSNGEALCFDFSDLSKWIYTMMARVHASHMGLHDTIPFWSRIDRQLEAPKVKSGVEFTSYDSVAPARQLTSGVVANKRFDQRRNNSNQFPSEMSGSFESGASNTKTIDKSDGDGSGEKKGRRRHRPRPRRGNSSRQSERHSNDTEVNRSGSDSSVMPSDISKPEDSFVDPTTKREDKTFEERKKRPLTGDSAASATM